MNFTYSEHIEDDDEINESDLNTIYDKPELEEYGLEIYSRNSKPSGWSNKHLIEKIYKNGWEIMEMLEFCLDKYYTYTFEGKDYESYNTFHELMNLMDFKVASDLELVDMVIRKKSKYTFKPTSFCSNDKEGKYIIRGIKRKYTSPFPELRVTVSYIDKVHDSFYKKNGVYIGKDGLTKDKNQMVKYSIHNVKRIENICDLIKSRFINSPLLIKSYALKHMLEKHMATEHTKYIPNEEAIMCCLLLQIDYDYIYPNMMFFMEKKQVL
jgi:hypothetical protein